MRVSFLLLLVITIIMSRQVPPQSSEPSLPLAGGSGKKGKKARKKQEGMDGKDGVVVVEEEKWRKLHTLLPFSVFAVLLLFPFSRLSGPMKRRIIGQYLQVFGGRKESFYQVREFLNTLVDARDELLQKSGNNRRSITIKKAMLSNSRNGRSSHDHLRLCDQVDRLEFEYERLKRDADFYHDLQEQLQLSPYYELMESDDEAEKMISEEAFAKGVRDTAFEELLAVEKKDDDFWRRVREQMAIPDNM